MEPSDEETLTYRKGTNRRQAPRRQKEDSAKVTSPGSEVHDIPPDNLNNVPADKEMTKGHPGGRTDKAVVACGSENNRNSLSPEKMERHLSEIEEIQEPSDLSEADTDSSHPVIIPLSPVYASSVTLATNEVPMQPAQPALPDIGQLKLPFLYLGY